MRVVSLLPACTEWVAAFDAIEDLVGRSHACDYPPGVEALPVLTHPAAMWAGATPSALDPFDVDMEALVELAPDLVLTRAPGAMCGDSEPQLLQALGDRMRGTRVISVSIDTMKDVLDGALSIGRALGRLPVAMQALGELEFRLSRLQRRLGLKRDADPASRPVVALLDRLDPLRIAGRLAHDLIEMAGATSAISTSRVGSTALAWDVLRDADPDVLALAPSGLSLCEARRRLVPLAACNEWKMLRAARTERVVLFDGGAYFNRAGPRLYRSIELLAAAVYGERAGIVAGADEMFRASLEGGR